MRIRSIKPEFWRSDDITSLDWHDRLLFIGLWSYVDDNGVGVDRLASITADLFAGDIERDPRDTFARVSRGLQQLSEAGRITRYTVDGKAYLHITNWDKHQRVDRPNKPRYPPPTSEDAISRETLARPSRDPRETPSLGTGEQGNRGTGEKDIIVGDADDANDVDRPEIQRLCTRLADRVEANGSKRPAITKKWRDATRLMLDRDGRSEEQIRAAIDWSQQHEFWRSNILSMPKLREKYDQLRLQASRPNTNGTRPSTTDQRVGAALDLASKYAQEGQ